MLKVPLCWEAILLDVGVTGEGGRPSRLRLPKDGGGGLPRDVTERTQMMMIVIVIMIASYTDDDDRYHDDDRIVHK